MSKHLRRKPRPVLTDVDLSVGEGTVVLLTGRNGAGKTTLLRVVAGMSLPTDLRDSMEYTKPEIVDHGDLTELTAGTQSGDYLDANFPAGTARGDLTFSTP